MDKELIKHKLNNPGLKTDPFIELRRCFDPCLSSMDVSGLSQPERTCMSKLTSQLHEQVHPRVRGFRKESFLPDQTNIEHQRS